MRSLVDECTGPAVAHWLREQKYEVFSVYEEARGISDDALIAKAYAENWILIRMIKTLARRFTENDALIRALYFYDLKMNERRTKSQLCDDCWKDMQGS